MRRSVRTTLGPRWCKVLAIHGDTSDGNGDADVDCTHATNEHQPPGCDFEILESVAKALPPDIHLPMGKASAGRVDGRAMKVWLDRTGLNDQCNSKKVYLRCPDLSAGRVSVSWCLWFMCRNCMKSDLLMGACKEMLDMVVQPLDDAIVGKSHQTAPTM